MQRNGQGKFLDHLINKEWDPAQAAALQSRLNGERNAFIQKALQTRPVYIPLQFVMDAAGRMSPYRQTTPSLGYKVIITGIRSDCAVDGTTDGVGGVVADGNRDIIIERSDETRPLLAADADASLLLRVDEVAGKTAAAGGGAVGVFSLPSPIVIPAHDRITVSMFKQDTTVPIEIANIVLIGVAVYGKDHAKTVLDAEQKAIQKALTFRDHPDERFLKMSVAFDTNAFGGAARDLTSPINVDEPLILKGLRTNLVNSKITLNIIGQPQWTVNPTPIWALAAEDNLAHDNYLWLPRPVYLPSGTTIQIPVITNGTGTAALPGALDPQTGNTITWLCETV